MHARTTSSPQELMLRIFAGGITELIAVCHVKNTMSKEPTKSISSHVLA